MKMESETVITQANEPEENQEEIYSCNTCGVSFTSVLEHIQNFHNDQDVVVEVYLSISFLFHIIQNRQDNISCSASQLYNTITIYNNICCIMQ